MPSTTPGQPLTDRRVLFMSKNLTSSTVRERVSCTRKWATLVPHGCQRWGSELAIVGRAVVKLTMRCRHHDAQLHVGLIVRVANDSPDTSKKSLALECATTTIHLIATTMEPSSTAKCSLLVVGRCKKSQCRSISCSTHWRHHCINDEMFPVGRG